MPSAPVSKLVYILSLMQRTTSHNGSLAHPSLGSICMVDPRGRGPRDRSRVRPEPGVTVEPDATWASRRRGRRPERRATSEPVARLACSRPGEFEACYVTAEAGSRRCRICWRIFTSQNDVGLEIFSRGRSRATAGHSVHACKGMRLHVIQPSANVRADPYDGLVA
jgi:hypothetical protein